MFTGAATDDVYLWTSSIKQYFVFMCGNSHIMRLHLQQLSFVELPMSGIWAMKGILGTDRPGIGLP